MNADFIAALDEIEREKGISRDVIFDAIEKALIKSYAKNYNDNANVSVKIDKETGKISVYAIKTVVEEVEDPIQEIVFDKALEISKAVQLGDQLTEEVTPMNFGRIAAQTARNIVIQAIKDAERDVIYGDFINREKEIITGNIHRIDRNCIYIDLGKTEGIVPPNEQVQEEHYEVNDRIKLYISEVKNTSKGAQIILSRTDPGLIVRLFELEVPEIHDGTVEIFSISREAGSRTKIAVFSKDPDVDSVGACVGFKGVRVNAIVDELQGEKIDIIVWDKDIKTFIANSLSPSDVVSVIINEEEKAARVVVPDDQLSLAIGKEGQNVRLAAKLTGWKIDIKGVSQQHTLELEGEDPYLVDVLKKKNRDVDAEPSSLEDEHETSEDENTDETEEDSH